MIIRKNIRLFQVETTREIDLEVRKILKEKYAETIKTLTENRTILDNVAQLLLKKETITGDEVIEIIKGKTAEEILNPNQMNEVL